MKFLLTTILWILILSGVKGQCLQDTLFQRDLKWSEEYVAGGKYGLQNDKKKLKEEAYGRSSFVKAADAPEFDFTGKPLNAVYFREIGDNPLIFMGLGEDEVHVVEEDTISFKVLRFECNGEPYKVFKNTRRTKNRHISQYSNILYNDLVDLAFVEKLEEALVGKTVYVLSAKWYEDKRVNPNVVPAESNTYKYYPVQITAVENDYNDKFIVYFKPQGSDETFCFINMTFGEKELRSSMNFSKRMTFKNPRGKYPRISDKKWKVIQEQKIEKGLTAEEIELAFGEPDEKYNKNGDDIWVYFNNNEKDYVLTFKKGKVHDYYTGPASRYIRLIF